MTAAAILATTLLGVAMLSGAAIGCGVDVPVGSDDSADPDASVDAENGAASPPTRLCAANGTSSVTGRGPDGRLDHHAVFANVRGGECRTAIELVLSPDPVLTMPYPPGTVVIVAPTPADLLAASGDLMATLPATIVDRSGRDAVPGRLEILAATGAGAPRLHARAVFDAAGWQLTAVVDATYCLIDECPTPIAAAPGAEAMLPSAP